MFENYRSTTTEQVLRSWISAEGSNEHRWKHLKEMVPEATLERLKSGHSAALFEEDWIVLVEAIKWFRSALLNSLLSLGPAWFKGELRVQELASVGIINYEPFVRVAHPKSSENWSKP